MHKQPTPVYSSRADDPELRDEIDQFVVQLAEQIDGIQDALCASDLDLLSTRCSNLERAGRIARGGSDLRGKEISAMRLKSTVSHEIEVKRVFR